MFQLFKKNNILGKEVNVKIKSWITHEYIDVLAKVDTGACSSSISKELASKLGKLKTIEKFEENIHRKKNSILKRIPLIKNIKNIKNSNGITRRAYIQTDLIIQGKKITSHLNVSDRKNLTYDFLLGARDLKGFIVNVDK